MTPSASPISSEPLDLPALVARVQRIRVAIDAADTRSELTATHPEYTQSARNLVHYVTLRHEDLRDLQRSLALLGLSSLGRSEADVRTTLVRVEAALQALLAVGHTSGAAGSGRPMLDTHADELFGPPPPGRRVRIMLTASADLAHDAARVRALLEAGTDVVRINCAHDTPAVWHAIARQVRAASATIGRPCMLLADLPGPKLRTGALEAGPPVVDWHVHHDPLGGMLARARVWLGEWDTAPPSTDVTLPMAGSLKTRLLRVGDGLRLTDVRGRTRNLRVESVSADGVLATADRAAWVASGTSLRRVRDRRLGPVVAVVGPLPPRVVPLVLHVDDHLRLTREDLPGGVDALGAHIPITLPEVLTAVRPGDPILFDDGKIAGEVLTVGADSVELVVVRAAAGGATLRSDKGVNLPATELPVPALTPHDLDCLDAVHDIVDMIGLSFVRAPGDVRLLREALAARGRTDLGVLLKIETRAGFESLPAILLEAMRGPKVGVMIARGDLAVECGFERLAEVQEEILWVCEAAHVPVVWATQVLDTLARRGVVTRAEVTDAAAAQRAECVMLNKGPHADLAVRMLDDILRRMSSHQEKKTAMLRRLRSIHAPGHDNA